MVTDLLLFKYFLLTENPDLSPFAQQARQLAQNYQVEKLESMMKDFIEA